MERLLPHTTNSFSTVSTTAWTYGSIPAKTPSARPSAKPRACWHGSAMLMLCTKAIAKRKCADSAHAMGVSNQHVDARALTGTVEEIAGHGLALRSADEIARLIAPGGARIEETIVRVWVGSLASRNSDGQQRVNQQTSGIVACVLRNGRRVCPRGSTKCSGVGIFADDASP